MDFSIYTFFTLEFIYGYIFLCLFAFALAFVFCSSFCASHLDDLLGLSVWESRIHGLGLFSTREFKKGAVICSYSGELLTKEQMDSFYGTAEPAVYAIHVKKTTWYIDAKKPTDGPARYANHSGDSPNIEFVSRIYSSGEPAVELVALRDITPCEELLVNYGDDYVFT